MCPDRGCSSRKGVSSEDPGSRLPSDAHCVTLSRALLVSGSQVLHLWNKGPNPSPGGLLGACESRRTRKQLYYVREKRERAQLIPSTSVPGTCDAGRPCF